MSSEALPINPARFAEAIKDLSLASLHLKVLELRNSIAHLDYSNEQLRPFADGKEATFGTTSGSGAAPQPDRDCIDAIKENEEVIERMLERIRLVRAEVESRGCSWTEFRDPAAEVEREAQTADDATAPTANGVTGGNVVNSESATSSAAATSGQTGDGSGTSGLSEAWRDGTIQMGVIRNGQLHMDEPPTRASASGGAGGAATMGGGGEATSGGSLTDEQLRRFLGERLDLGEDDDADGGLHL